ncbi:hypothetical protein [Paenibacillus cymbidii]|uniref:hypothetical protein n=1 Tax=Paenibacillus cymbidii TaxID=1639034 RepID=UPI00108189E3|nr:hypothetical protein [Paenibacillus cymbidii]
MGRLGETLAIERGRLFVGRNAEFAAIRAWIHDRMAPTGVLFVSGIGGVGKTSFLLKTLDLAAQAGLGTIWIDGRTCRESPAGFIEAVSADQTSFRAMFRTKSILCVDNYDTIHMIDSWLREAFLPQMPDVGLLVLLVSRQNLTESWLTDLAWRSRVRHMTLQPFSRQEASEYWTRNSAVAPCDIERLMAETQGLPLALAVTAEKRRLSGTETWPLALRISADLLREVTSPDLRETLDLLCILPQAAPEWFARWLRVPLGADRLLQLSRLSFVRPTEEGLALHDVARYYLKEDFMRREPDRMSRLRAQIARDLVGDIKAATDSYGRSKLVAVLLSVTRDAFRIGAISVLPQHADQQQMETFRQNDLPYLQRILQEQSELAVSIERDLAVLRALAEQFPACIRVFRSREGVPLAFCAGFYLDRDTTRFHETFFPGVLERAYPDEIEAMRRRTAEQADTFYQLLAGTAVHNPDYSFLELIGIVISYWLIVHSAGMRAVMINTFDGLNEVLLQLGYRMRPLSGLPEDHPFSRATVRELDWRTVDIGDVILGMPGMDATAPSTVDAPAIPDKMIRSALPFALDPDRLERTELARLLGIGGGELHEKLQKLLEGAPVYPLDDRMQQMLRQMCEQASLSAEQAAERLHVSRATYFRMRGEVIRVVGNWLKPEGP